MAKDYAKLYAGRNKRAPANSIKYYVGIIIASLVLGIGLIVLLPSHFLSEQLVSIRARLKIATTRTPSEKPKATIEQPPTPIKFNFYEELPANHLAIKPLPQPKIAARPATSAARHYVLQLGVFSDFRSAAQTRLNFLLAGIDTVVVKEKTSAGTVFRIQQGPYATERLAHIAEKRLVHKGVTPIVRQVVEFGPNAPT